MERRLLIAALGPDATADDEQAGATACPTHEECGRLLARPAILGRLEHGHRAEHEAVLDRPPIDLEWAGKRRPGGVRRGRGRHDRSTRHIHSCSQLSGGCGPHMFMWYQGASPAIMGG